MIYFFSKSTRAAGGSRHRAFNVVDFLRARGYEARLVVPPVYRATETRFRARLDYLKTILSLRRNDVVVLQTPIFSRWFVALMCMAKYILRPRVIFDFDDAIWRRNPIATRAFAHIADEFIVATHYLAKWPPLGKKPVTIIPNLVDLDLAMKYRMPKESGDKVVLGWIGGAHHSLPNLRILVPVFEALIKNGVSFKFKIVGVLGSRDVRDAFQKIVGLDVEFVDSLDWAKEGEIQETNRSFDIGLCPLLTNEDNEARCSLKVLDYMAAELPVVISNIGEHRHFVDHGVNGFLADTTEEWIKYLSLLICDEDLRRRIGRAAGEKIERHYTYQTNIDKYVTILKGSIKSKVAL
jgi:glycosyltransferase involved in cell wall biosynthesis